MALELILPSRTLDRSIASGLRKRQLHRLIKELKSLHFLNRPLRALYGVEDDESLALGFQVCLCDYVDDLAILGEELGQGFFELVWLDALLKIADVDSAGC